MPTYETLVIVRPDLGDDDERSAVDALTQIVTEGGGTMVANDRMGRRRLAYPIQKFDEGVYARFLYDAEAAVPKELERRTGISDRVLRTLTVRLERDWAIAAKEQAVIDAKRRAEAAIEAEAAAARAAEEEAAAAVKAAEAAAAAPEGEGTEIPAATASAEETPPAEPAAVSAPAEASPSTDDATDADAPPRPAEEG